MRLLLIIWVFIGSYLHLIAQNDTAYSFKKRKLLLGFGTGTTAAIGTTALYYAWYKDYNTGKFHTFNDNTEWLQMDKAGHAITNYQIGNVGYNACKWAGMSESKSIWMGGTSGMAYMTVIECLDGFSEGWGFSWGDMSANAGGTLLFTTQQYFWKEQRIKLKFSFHQSDYWHYRPQLLGNNLAQQLLKDYNGQTYWLSINPSSFMKKHTKFPSWLNIAFGYGANRMISGKDDFVLVRSDGSIIGNDRYRRSFVSLDVDFSKVKTRYKFLNKVFKTINWIKIPFPTIELSNKKISGHLLYF